MLCPGTIIEATCTAARCPTWSAKVRTAGTSIYQCGASETRATLKFERSWNLRARTSCASSFHSADWPNIMNQSNTNTNHAGVQHDSNKPRHNKHRAKFLIHQPKYIPAPTQSKHHHWQLFPTSHAGTAPVCAASDGRTLPSCCKSALSYISDDHTCYS